MVRSKWMMSLAAAVASTGLVLGQQTDRIITVGEPGKPAHKCQVLESYQKPDGTQVYKVKDLVTGEVFPIEEPHGSGVNLTAASETTVSTPAPVPAPVADPAPAAQGVTGRVITVTESGKAPQKARIVQTWKMADGLRAYQVQSLDGGEMMTIVETGPTAPATPGAPVRAMATRIFHWDRSNMSPAEAPMPPAAIVQSSPPPTTGQDMRVVPTTTTVIKPAPTNATVVKPTPAPKLSTPTVSSPYASSPSASMATTASPWKPTTTSLPSTTPVQVTSPAPSVQTIQMTELPPPAPIRTTTTVETRPAVEPAQPMDWRKSWGKTDSPAAVKTDDSSSEHKFRLLPQKPVNADPRTTSSGTQTAGKSTTGDAKKDPLSDPAAYTRTPVEQKADVSSQATKAIGNTPGAMRLPELPSPTAKQDVTTVSLPPALPTSPKDVAPISLPPAAAPQLPPAPSALPATPPADGHLPLGAKSVTDAGDSRYIPVPIVTVPQPRHEPRMPGEIPQNRQTAPVPANQDMVNAFTPAPPGGQAPAGPAAFNAFSGSMPAAQQLPPAPVMMPPAYAGVPKSAMPTLPAYASMQQAMAPRAPTMPGQGQPVAQAAYYQAGQPTVTPPQSPGVRSGTTASASEAQLPSRGSMSTPQLMGMLHDSLYPSQREWAADQIAGLDWKSNESAVDALVKAAREDPAPTVRAGCVRCLAKMNVNTLPIVTALQAMQTDADPRVQTEVEHALSKLGAQPARATK